MSQYLNLYKRVQANLKAKGIEVEIRVIEKCFRHQFKFTRKIIETGDWYAVRLQYLGIFGVKTNRVKYTNQGEIRNQVIEANKGDIVTVKTPSNKYINIRV
jgi:hypothetical protein